MWFPLKLDKEERGVSGYPEVGSDGKLTLGSYREVFLGSAFFLLLSFFFFLVYFVDYAITVVPFFTPLYSPTPCTPPPTSNTTLSSCSRVICISSLASPFPILFLTSLCLFCTYHLCFLFPVPFLPFSPIPPH